MHIKSILQDIKSFAELEPIVKKAQTHLSFWGARYITVIDYEGKLPIDTLASKVLELVRKNPDFDEIERQHGKSMMRPIDNIYRKSDELVKKAKCLTKFFAKLRSIPNLILSGFRHEYSNIRWHWRECEVQTELTSCPDNRGYYKVFRLYTESQYKKVFGELPRPATKQLYELKNPYLKPPGLDINDQEDWFDNRR